MTNFIKGKRKGGRPKNPYFEDFKEDALDSRKLSITLEFDLSFPGMTHVG